METKKVDYLDPSCYGIPRYNSSDLASVLENLFPLLSQTKVPSSNSVDW